MFNLMSSFVVPKRSHTDRWYDYNESSAIIPRKNLARLALCREAIDSCPHVPHIVEKTES